MEEDQTKGKRREERRLKKRRKMQQHGKGLAHIYRDAVMKRIRRKKSR